VACPGGVCLPALYRRMPTPRARSGTVPYSSDNSQLMPPLAFTSHCAAISPQAGCPLPQPEMTD